MLPGAPTDSDFTDPIIAGGFIVTATVAVPRDPDGHLLVLRDRPRAHSGGLFMNGAVTTVSLTSKIPPDE